MTFETHAEARHFIKRNSEIARGLMADLEARKGGPNTTKTLDTIVEDVEAARHWLDNNVDRSETEFPIPGQHALNSAGSRLTERSTTPNVVVFGDGVRGFRHGAPIYDYVTRDYRSPSGVRADELNIGRALRGYITGDWTNADAERRAMADGSDTAGGFTLPRPMSAQLIDLARNQARVSQAGAVTIPMTTFSIGVAKLTGDPTAEWKPENSTVNSSDLTFGRVDMRARTLMCLVKSSIELWQDSGNINEVVSRTLGSALALELDRAALRGGADGNGPDEPVGIRHTDGIQTTDLSSDGLIDFDDFSTAIENIANVNGPTGDAISILYNAKMSGSLDRRKDGEGQYLLPNGASQSFRDARKFVTNQIANTYGSGSDETEVYTGDFSQLYLGARTDVLIEVSREAGDAFAKGQVWIRAYLRGDVALAKPDHFHVHTGIDTALL